MTEHSSLLEEKQSKDLHSKFKNSQETQEEISEFILRLPTPEFSPSLLLKLNERTSSLDCIQTLILSYFQYENNETVKCILCYRTQCVNEKFFISLQSILNHMTKQHKIVLRSVLESSLLQECTEQDNNKAKQIINEGVTEKTCESSEPKCFRKESHDLLQDAVDAVIASKTCNFMCKESRNICGKTFYNSYELVRIFLVQNA